MIKICSVCKIEKLLTDFYFHKNNKDGLYTYCKACVLIKNNKHKRENRKKNPEETRIKDKENNQSIHGKYQTYKNSAKKRDIIFDLTKNDFKTFWQKPCHYCDASIKTIGIDRKDNSVGYTLDNCLSCCKICNLGKHTSTYEEYIDHCKRIAKKWLDAV